LLQGLGAVFLAFEVIMRSLAFLLGVILIVLAAVYLLLPADSLPSFLPGYEAGLMRPRIKHGVAAGVVGVMLFVVGWVLGRRHD
jgi:hypothetical protein